jgi:hypothetical protein
MSLSDDRLHTTIDPALKKKLQNRADEHGVAMCDVVEAALDDYFDDEDYKTVSLEYLARIERKYSTVLKRVDLLVEGFALFVRVWFQHHPRLHDEKEKKQRGREAKHRFQSFQEKLADLFRGDQSFRKGFEDAVARPEDFPHKEDL